MKFKCSLLLICGIVPLLLIEEEYFKQHATAAYVVRSRRKCTDECANANKDGYANSEIQFIIIHYQTHSLVR